MSKRYKGQDYESQVWRYLVREFGQGRHSPIIPNGQTDSERVAIELCRDYPKMAQVIKVATDEVVYRNWMA